MRCLTFTAAILAVLFSCAGVTAARTSELIPRTVVNQHGLSRPWFTQVEMDRHRSRVAHLTLDDGTLFIQTDRAMIQAIDAETGRSLWANQVGNPNSPSLMPGVNEDLVAVVNGSTLFILSRHTGKLLWKHQVADAPGGGAALSQQWAYVPMVNGKAVAYRLEPKEKVEIGDNEEGEKEDLTPEEKEKKEIERRKSFRLKPNRTDALTFQSYGRAFVQPVIVMENESEEFVAWATDRGFLFVGRIDRRDPKTFAPQYHLTTDKAIVSKPTVAGPDPDLGGRSGVIYVTSRDGFVRALLANDGAILWRFSTGVPITKSPIKIGRQVFVVTQLNEMYCLDAKNGAQKWQTPNIADFLAASKDRVYAADTTGKIAVLDRSHGVRVDKVPLANFAFKMANSETDRLYFVSESGLVQCLRETELTEPIRHTDPKVAKAKKAVTKEENQKPANSKPQREQNPFGGEDTEKANSSRGIESEADGNPFGD